MNKADSVRSRLDALAGFGHLRRHVYLLLAVCLFSSSALADEAVDLETPRGATVRVIAQKPAGAGPFPAVVLASGSGYHMRQPLLAQLAQALLAEGVAVLRFDWAYYVADPGKGRQSTDRLAEIEDLRTVLALARRSPDIDARRIVVAGKSLGSIIAWRVFREEPQLRAALLLTPVCGSAESPRPPQATYPDAAVEVRASAWVLGDADPVCASPILYRFLADAGRAHRIAVFDGDHAFAPQADRASANAEFRQARTLEQVVRYATGFVMSALAVAAPP